MIVLVVRRLRGTGAGLVVGLFTVASGYAYAVWANRRWEIPLRSSAELSEEEMENFAGGNLRLDDDVVAEANRIINQQTVVGDRYNASTLAEIDTEQFGKD